MRQTVPILMYHSVDYKCDPAYRRWAVSPSTFKRHMSLITEANCIPITVSQFIEMRNSGEKLPQKAVVITFDDGLQDFLHGAVPVLQHYGFAATLYVVAGLVGKTSRWLADLGEAERPMLTWRELREVASLGIEVGGHSMTHPKLDILTITDATQEVQRSKSTLEENLGQAVRSFAYPHGYSTSALRRAVQETGYTSACRVRHALSSSNEDSFALSRIIVEPEMKDETFIASLQGKGLPVAPPTERLISTAWRQVRRIRKSLSAASTA